MDLFGEYSTKIDEAEYVAHEQWKKFRKFIPLIAKICLLSTYFEDGFRMYYQYKPQKEFFEQLWNCHWTISGLIVLINFFGQLIPCFLILLKKYEVGSISVLASTVVFQAIAYRTFTDYIYMLRVFSLLGGLILLYVTCRPPAVANEILFGSLPPISDYGNTTDSYLQLCGRVLLTFMFVVSMLNEEFDSVLVLVRIAISTALMILFLIGYKTMLAGSLAASYLFLLNIFLNRFWSYPTHSHLHDYYRFEFFQNMSIIGGMLVLVSTGPGNVSLDEQKKKW